MENPQMGMPQKAAPNPFSDPNTEAVFGQMRQEISPQEFSNEMLASASQIDPQTVAAFTKELQGINIPPEVLDALNNVVDEILASPDRYDELRKKYMDMGLPEEILPKQFDPQFFAALNMAIDQMIAAPTGVQAFAKGGIAELKPIAKVIASYGRNGDTMLAHITPAEARMLRRRGGSGTINPNTGLPEFFNLGKALGLDKVFEVLVAPIRVVAKAVQSFAKSSVGKIVLPIALGFFLGPAAAGLFGVGATSVAGLAISGFVGSAGSTLLAGGSLKDALRSGAIGGLTAGAVAGVGNLTGLSNIPLTGTPSTASFGQSISNQFDAFGKAVSNPVSTLKGLLPGSASPTPGLGTNNLAPLPRDFDFAGIPGYENSVTAPAAPGAAPLPTTSMISNAASLPSADDFIKANNAYLARSNTFVPPTDNLDSFLKSNNAFGTAASNPAASSAIARPTAPGADFGIGDPGAGFERTYAPGKTPYSSDLANTVARDSSVPAGTQGLNKTPSLVDQAKDFYNRNISPSGIQEAGRAEALSKTMSQFPSATADQIMTAPANSILGKAYTSNMPGLLSTYGPMAAIAGIGLSSLGGFKPQPVQTGAITQSLMTPVTQRIRQDGTQRQMYLQNMPGVVYDQYGEPTDGYSRLPTYDVPNYNAGGYGMYSASGQGNMNMPTVYNTPSGSIGSSRVEQPYNNANMYSNLVPRRFNNGGIADFDAVQPYIPGPVAPPPKTFNWNRYLEANPDLERAGIDTEEKAKAHWTNSGLKEGRPMNPEEAAIQQATKAATDASNLAARTKVAQEKAMRKAQGSGNMYANINAGLAALAPETFPGDPVTLSSERRAAMDAALKGTVTDVQKARVMRDNKYRPEEMAAYANLGYGEVNRRYNTALRQDAYAPMLQEQRNAMNQQRDIAYNVPAAAPVNTGTVSQSPFPGKMKIHSEMDGVGSPFSAQANPYSNIMNAQPGYTGPNLYSQVLAGGLAPTPEGKMAAYQNLIQQGATAPQIKYAAETIYGPQPSLPGGTVRPMNMGGADPFYQQRMGLDAQVNAQNSQGQNATPAQLAEMRRLSELSENDPGVNARRDALNKEATERGIFYTQGQGNPSFMNMGGIAGLAAGGYPRRNGQISGPGTEKSDSIPAMLSDGEFVMTAKAVRGAGKGSRRAGAKKMYKLMHQLEKNSERG
jgi:hypothetical protein